MNLLTRISGYTSAGQAALSLDRTTIPPAKVEDTVREIVADVRRRGDTAVRDYTLKFDSRDINDSGCYELDTSQWDQLIASVDDNTIAALRHAAQRITQFHEPQKRGFGGYTWQQGGRMQLRATPLACVGLYVPGGSALYPSSVLMTAIPARVAGVKQIIMCTPGASAETVAAAKIAGVDRIFQIGGAQAVAAMAFGTYTIPRVDKIVGPGNQWVAAAKRQVFGAVDIDSVAGPSEVLVIADNTANPRWVAADLLAQAEHDTEARVVLVSLSPDFPSKVEAELHKQLPTLERQTTAYSALQNYGAYYLADTMRDAVAFANTYGPEHLELVCRDAEAVSQQCTTAGAIFIGDYTPEAAGDYVAGPNHVLPTSGAARYASPLGVYDFFKWTSVLHNSKQDLATQRQSIVAIAKAEGLTAHLRSVEIRFEKDGEASSSHEDRQHREEHNDGKDK